jgi:integrase
MAKGFTDIAIRNLKAGDVRREIPDPGAAGLYLIIQPSGKKSFAVRYRFNGKPKKLTLPGGLTLAAARRLASDALYALEKGDDPAAAKRQAQAKGKAIATNTVQALCETYLKREAGKLRTGLERRRVLERLVYPSLGDVPLTDLKRSTIVTMLDDIEDRCGAPMADMTLAYLRKVLSWHASRVDDFNSPIVKGMARYDARSNQGTRTLSDGELRAVWQATDPNTEAPEPFHSLVRFILLTAARRAEAAELPWSEIDGSNWTLPAERNKVKADLTRPLSKAARAVLETVPVIGGGVFVFSNDGHRPMHLTVPTVRLKQVTGTGDWRIHDLRRTSRTLMSRCGISSDTCERCLGHTIGGIRGVYDLHKYQDEMLAAYEALAALIERIVYPVANVTPLRRQAGE